MRNNLIVLSLVAAFTLTASLAFAGTGAAMRISVPFDFYAGDQQLPAGEYIFEMGSGFLPTASVVTVRANEGTGICILATQAGTDRDLESSRLRFNRYGDRHFLSSISIRGFRAGFKTVKLEKELRAHLEKGRNVVIVAQK